MHGVILTELEKLVTQHRGADAWREVQRRAELPARIYVTSATYPDSDVVALVGAASALTGKPASEVMEAFGEAIVPGLLQVYGRMVKKGWRTLDVLEHTEAAIHTVIRRQTPGAEPPQLSCVRSNPGEVIVTYGFPPDVRRSQGDHSWDRSTFWGEDPRSGTSVHVEGGW